MSVEPPHAESPFDVPFHMFPHVSTHVEPQGAGDRQQARLEAENHLKFREYDGLTLLVCASRLLDMTTYIRYSQVQVGDCVKLEDGFIWRDRRTAERDLAPFLTVAAIEDAPAQSDLVIVTTDGQRFNKPKTSKALVKCAFCAPDELCADHVQR